LVFLGDVDVARLSIFESFAASRVPVACLGQMSDRFMALIACTDLLRAHGHENRYAAELRSSLMRAVTAIRALERDVALTEVLVQRYRAIAEQKES
jgi:hypothetical protein